uniref:Pre-B lymphocyte 3 protein n=1 Tax=Monodelphis domestica TaxID=13616 RepID=I7AG26_MONDO|nr:pre-B lymphocyte 3 protein [Monodelphis domestica]
MAPHLLVLLLIPVLLAQSQRAPSQPEALVVFPGQTARLLCSLQPEVAISERGISWFQQFPGSAPRFLLYYYNEEEQERRPGLPERFGASKDATHNACILTISPVQPEDEADYYCSLAY